jgi:hypothetical protein
MHSAAVAKALCAAGPNEVLGRYPPNVHESEETLPRIHRCTLRQLRSGKCYRLQTFQHRIGKAANDLCPECGVASHTTAHIFNCRTFPTTLIVDDLWYNPREAAIFVSNLPSFIRHLPPVPPSSASLPSAASPLKISRGYTTNQTLSVVVLPLANLLASPTVRQTMYRNNTTNQ